MAPRSKNHTMGMLCFWSKQECNFRNYITRLQMSTSTNVFFFIFNFSYSVSYANDVSWHADTHTVTHTLTETDNPLAIGDCAHVPKTLTCRSESI